VICPETWQYNRPYLFIVLWICRLAESYVNGAAARVAGTAASRGGRITQGGQICMSGQPVFFEPIAVETLGVFNSSADSLLKEIGSKISLNT